MDSKTKHRLAQSLDLAAFPRGNASPETVDQVKREISSAHRINSKLAVEKERAA